ncbi:unnamed protein product [Leptidea sinapis]|uniref:Uncharacterized protein n=1 Tax=Leptidea sinapis TaxID=189913 RepID=A0A5E4Q828_9NEOP|nr:unnamed protein product [Leptidea sinapis]
MQQHAGRCDSRAARVATPPGGRERHVHHSLPGQLLLSGEYGHARGYRLQHPPAAGQAQQEATLVCGPAGPRGPLQRLQKSISSMSENSELTGDRGSGGSGVTGEVELEGGESDQLGDYDVIDEEERASARVLSLDGARARIVVLANHSSARVRAAVVRLVCALDHRRTHPLIYICQYEGSAEVGEACAALLTGRDVPLHDQTHEEVWDDVSDSWCRRACPLLGVLPAVR